MYPLLTGTGLPVSALVTVFSPCPYTIAGAAKAARIAATTAVIAAIANCRLPAHFELVWIVTIPGIVVSPVLELRFY
jgi:hypothetical protein